MDHTCLQGDWDEDLKVRGVETFPDGSSYDGECEFRCFIALYCVAALWVCL